MDSMKLDSLRCPTCRAEQPWSDTCRRCKCDLRLLRELAEVYAATRKRCLVSLRENQLEAALEQAKQGFILHAGADSRRLLATCELLNGNWRRAMAHGEQLSED
jgi:hypothetical protein